MPRGRKKTKTNASKIVSSLSNWMSKNNATSKNKKSAHKSSKKRTTSKKKSSRM